MGSPTERGTFRKDLDPHVNLEKTFSVLFDDFPTQKDVRR